MATNNPYLTTGAEAVIAEQCRARGPTGAVAAAAPVAAVIAADMLRAGGNAYDAVVAASLAETVLLPPKCGLSGDLIALAWHADQDQPEALLGIGGAPAGLADVARRRLLRPTGPLAVGVPGAPAGYNELAKRARRPLAELAAPAIALAKNGFCWSRICSSLSHESADLVARHNPDGTAYYPNGNVIAPGTVTKLPGLAEALDVFAADPDGFLRGPVGRAIVEHVRASGGVLALDDFDFAAAEWIAPAAAGFDDATLYVTPAPTHGAALLEALRGVSRATPAAAASVLDGVQRAIKWRERELCDPSGTSMVSAVDADGTLATVVHSNSYPRFGSGLIVERYNLILSNRAGRGYASEPGHPNFPERGRRPATTLNAWAVAQSDNSRIIGATPGGANQMPWNAQTLARLASGENDPGKLIVAPRWEWRPGGQPLRVEEGFTDTELAVLGRIAGELDMAARWATHSAMQIVTVDGGGVLRSAAADPRTVGVALAF